MSCNHVLSCDQFNRSRMERLFHLCSLIEKTPSYFSEELRGRVVSTLFYEPSTRTRLSFESAVYRLGGQVITVEDATRGSSATKGETLEDTIKMISGYADGIVLRHNEKGACSRAALVSDVPIINAGDGDGEHPTQALLDAYTIQKCFGQISGLKIAFLGDLKYGRTVHSLLLALIEFGPSVVYAVSPEELSLPEDLVQKLQAAKIRYVRLPSMVTLPSDLDVLYLTRIQIERFVAKENMTVESLNSDALNAFGDGLRIFHPLPRRDELPTFVDADPRAIYFKQARNGPIVRMALLMEIFNTPRYEIYKH